MEEARTRQRATQRKYLQSEKGQATQRKYLQSEKGQATQRKYQQSEKCQAYRRKYQQSEKYQAYQRKYRQSEEGRAGQRKYRQSEKGRTGGKVYAARRLARDPEFKIRHQLRCRMNMAVKASLRPGSTTKDLGCTAAELRQHLENHFYGEMSWDNHGVYWQIDHIQPLASFDLTNREQFLRACHWTNLQPLTVEDNQSKGGRCHEHQRPR